MQSLGLYELRDMVNAAGVSAATNVVDAITEGFNTLGANEARTEDEEKLYFELAVNLCGSNYHGLRAAALTAYSDCIAANGADFYRPVTTPEEVPTV